MSGQAVGELAALQRLHHDDAHALLGGVAQTRVARLELGVHVVVLDLSERPAVVLVADAHEVCSGAVEGEGREADAPVATSASRKSMTPRPFIRSQRRPVQTVEQVEVEVVGPEPLELLGEEAVHVARTPGRSRAASWWRG